MWWRSENTIAWRSISLNTIHLYSLRWEKRFIWTKQHQRFFFSFATFSTLRHHRSFALISASGCELWLGVGRIKEQRLELAGTRAKKSSRSFRKNVRKSGCFVQITDAGQMSDAQRRCWHTINLFIQESSSVTVKGTARKEERKAVYKLQCVPQSNVNQPYKNLVYLVVLIIFKTAVRTVIWKNFQIPVISSLSKYCSMFWTNTNPSAKQSVTFPPSALFKHALMHYCWTDIWLRHSWAMTLTKNDL